jgi:OmpA-OmpF porin, OOP family
MANMKKLIPLMSLGMVVVLSSCVGMSEQGNKASSDKPIYWVGSDGKYVRDSYGSCVRTIEWKKETALAECEPGMAKKPAVVAAPAPAPAPAPAAVAKAMPKSEPVVPAIQKVTLKEDALFDIGKADLRDKGKGELNALAVKFKDKNFNVEKISVTGHASSTGAAAFNQSLSERRAEAVKSYLIQQGVDANLISTQGMGSRQPIASNNTAAGRAQNRRVELEIKAQQTTTSSN